MALPVDIYVRVSRIGKRENIITTDVQEARGFGFAKEHGLDVGMVLPYDLDESGGKLDRPGLQMGLERIESGQSGGIIVAWLDRLTRDSEHSHAIVRRAAEAGGRIYAPDAPDDWTTADGELQVGILFLFAQYLRKKTREGFETAKRKAITEGRPILTEEPFGYRLNDERNLVLDPDEAPIVRELFERRAAGEGCLSLARWLNGTGVKTPLGNFWIRQSVEKLFGKRCYLGELSYGRDRRYVNEAAHEPIVDLALFAAAQAPKQAPSKPRSGDSPWIVTGLLRCASCGYAMKPGTGGSRGRRIYRCGGMHAGGVCPARARISAKVVEAQALEQLRVVLETKIKAKPKRDDGSGRVAKLEAELAKLEARHEQHADPDTRETIGDDAVWKAGLKKLREQRDAKAAEVGAARLAMPVENGRSPADILDDLGEMSDADRREMLALHFDCIVVTPERRLFAFGPGLGPSNLPRRGQRRSDAVLCPIALPDAAAVAG